MQVDILGVRIVFGFLTVAMLILVHGLLFNYNLIILALATSCMAAFFFITAVSAKKLAQSNFKFNRLQKISILLQFRILTCLCR